MMRLIGRSAGVSEHAYVISQGKVPLFVALKACAATKRGTVQA